MQWIDEKGRIFGKINLLDALVVLFFVVLITATAVYIFAPPVIDKQQETTVMILFDDIPSTLLSSFEEGTPVNAYKKGEKGEVIDYYALPFAVASELHSDLLVVFNITATESESDFFAFNGFQLVPGSYIDIDINDQTFPGEVFSESFFYPYDGDFKESNVMNESKEKGDKKRYVYDTYGTKLGHITSEITLDKSVHHVDHNRRVKKYAIVALEGD